MSPDLDLEAFWMLVGSGHLPRLKLGIGLEDVIKHFGLPDDFSSNELLLQFAQKVRDNSIFGIDYGCLELIFQVTEQKLISMSITLDERYKLYLPQVLGANLFNALYKVTLDEFRNQIAVKKIYICNESVYAGEALFLKIAGSNVSLSFDLEIMPSRLYKVISSIWNTPCK